MLEANNEYSYQVEDSVWPAWDNILDKFKDASLYQTTSFELPNRKRYRISYLALSSGGRIVSCAQVRLGIIPLFGKGIAYIRWGPLWHLKDEKPNSEILRNMLRVLRNEYVRKRGLVLRVLPRIYDDELEDYSDILREEGYSISPGQERDRTLVIDLRPPAPVLRKGLDQKWRNHLNQAERHELIIEEGNDLFLYEKFCSLYEAMAERKRLKAFDTLNRFREMHRDLPERYKFRIFLCQERGVYCGGLVGSGIGETGITLLRAVNESGMKNRAAYLLHWRFLQWLKENQCSFYDMSGINPERNPGTYAYKAGLCGKNGRDIRFLGLFDAYPNPLIYKLFKGADKTRNLFRKLRGKQKAQRTRPRNS